MKDCINSNTPVHYCSMNLKKYINRNSNLVSAKNVIIRALPVSIRRLIHFYHIRGWTEFLRDLRSDRRSHKSCHRGSHLFLIIGLPKSGTTWLEQLLDCIPETVQLNRSALRAFPHGDRIAVEGGISRQMLLSAPSNKISFLKVHTPPSLRYTKILEDMDTRFVVVIRDPRDQSISSMHHSLAVGSDPFNALLLGTPKSKRLLVSMSSEHPQLGMARAVYWSKWIVGWSQYVDEHSDSAMIVRYEDVVDDMRRELERILDFYSYRYSEELMDTIVATQEHRQTVERQGSLSNNLSLPGRMASTYHSGTPGGWRDVYDDELTTYAKRIFGKALRVAGYETDDNW